MRFSESLTRESDDYEAERLGRLLYCQTQWLTEMGALSEVLVRLDFLKKDIAQLRTELRERKK